MAETDPRLAAKTAAAEDRGRRAVLGWLAGVGVPAAVGIGVWAHGSLWGHESRIVTLEAQRKEDDKQTVAAEARADRQFEELKSDLRRILDKLDRVRP